MRASIAGAATLALALAAAALPSPAAAAASQKVKIRELSGSGDHSQSLARSDDKPGASVYGSHHFEWAIAPGSRRRVLALPRSGTSTVSVPLRMHIVSTGGGVYIDGLASPPQEVPYTCTAESSYRTRAALMATPRVDGGWKVRLRALRPLKPGPPSCTDDYAEDYFMWATGGPWFVDHSTAFALLPRSQRHKAELGFANDPVPYDCTEVPGVTTACTEDLAWSATLRI